MSIIIPLIIGVLVGVGAGYGFFRYVLKKKYLRMIDTANHEAEVIKEKKLLEVKEKFLNKKAELEKEVQQRNQRILQVENKLKQREKLEELSGLSAEEAKKRLVDSLKDEARTDAQS